MAKTCCEREITIMCILFLHVNPNPQRGEYRLIIASNRDEYYRRLAEDAFQCKTSGIIGGRDMEKGREGGMWLGMVSKNQLDARQLCFAALLNITGEKIEDADGRGVIVHDYLNTKLTAEDYITNLRNTNKNYSGFNFVAVELSDNKATTYHFGNKPPSENTFHDKQTLGFGNSPIFSPLTKIQCGEKRFKEILNQSLSKSKLIDELIKLLKDEEKRLPDEELQRRAPTAYEFLSSNFVRIEPAGYGTRAHSVILVDYDWNLEFIEHAMKQPIDVANPQWSIKTIKSNL